jgi:hypothetical protein
MMMFRRKSFGREASSIYTVLDSLRNSGGYTFGGIILLESSGNSANHLQIPDDKDRL